MNRLARAAMASAFKSANESLSGEQLTEITQRTLDRLVFLRFLEDKLICEGQQARLSQAALETLAVVAYLQSLGTQTDAARLAQEGTVP